MATHKEIKEYAQKLKDMNAEEKRKQLEEYEAAFFEFYTVHEVQGYFSEPVSKELQDFLLLVERKINSLLDHKKTGNKVRIRGFKHNFGEGEEIKGLLFEEMNQMQWYSNTDGAI